MNIDQLDEKQLQAALLEMTKATQEQFGPYLYYLREKMKRSGHKGEGWAVWVKANLPFSLETANIWARKYGEEHHLPVAEKRPERTSSKNTRGPDVYQLIVPRPEWFTKAKAKELQHAIKRVGGPLEAFHIYVEAVIEAANGKAQAHHA